MALKTIESRSRDSMGMGNSVLVSVLLHLLACGMLGISALFTKEKPPSVPLFELVSLEKPKLRPLRPKIKTAKPPPPKPPEPVREVAPKLTPTPVKAVEKKKPEPKIVKEEPDTTLPVVEAPPVYEEPQPQLVMQNVGDPRLSLWASRVKKKAETLWNPPTGMDISADTKVVINFRVQRDGTLENPKVMTGTSNETLNDLALRTIVRMEHVPPIPPNFPEDVIEVGIEFIYKNE